MFCNKQRWCGRFCSVHLNTVDFFFFLYGGLINLDELQRLCGAEACAWRWLTLWATPMKPNSLKSFWGFSKVVLPDEHLMFLDCSCCALFLWDINKKRSVISFSQTRQSPPHENARYCLLLWACCCKCCNRIRGSSIGCTLYYAPKHLHVDLQSGLCVAINYAHVAF